MRRRIGGWAMILALSWCAAAQADLVPFGQRYVPNERYLDNLGDYPEYVFFVANDRNPEEFGKNILPSYGPSSTPWYQLASDGHVGQTHFSRVQTTAHLYAVPRQLAQQEAPNESWFSRPKPGILKSDVPIENLGYWESTTGLRFTLDRTDKIITHYRVELADSGLQLHRISLEQLDTLGRPVGTLSRVVGGAFAALAVASIGVIYVRRRRRQSAAAAT